ncbi:MAG: ABC transporter permease [Abitibacteriaceae bacterium]|nr:ABC transporter permease [Abditibacteriaceae bacterium]MBV9865313.1 ABC transporter permease [Abditibacteriaceae bacterium]
MLLLALRNLTRRPLRNALTLSGLAVAVAVLACLSAFGQGYRSQLGSELDRMGMQVMLVPLGCPYDAAARVLKGKTLDNSLPASALTLAQHDPAVAVAAPLLMVALPRPSEGRTDMWVGLDRAALPLKPWWRMKSHVTPGSNWFPSDDSVILGAEAAVTEAREPGDKFYSPETGQTLRVAGVLERSGTSDDSLFFVPLATAQKMFHQPGRLTAIALRLRDPALISEATTRLQRIPGAQVVTLTEMMGTFLNLVGSVRTLLLAIAVLAVTISTLSVFNTLLAAVVERTGEFSIMRALGASRSQVFGLITIESLLLTGLGSACGMGLAAGLGYGFENIVKQWVPFAPSGSLLSLTSSVMLRCILISFGVGIGASLYPAWQASRLHPADAVKMD